VLLIARRAYGFHSAAAAIAPVMLCCGPITLRLAYEGLLCQRRCNNHSIQSALTPVTHIHVGRADIMMSGYYAEGELNCGTQIKRKSPNKRRCET
jgi:hypothetical protein